MPTFCRHNRLVQNCPICAREQDVVLRPVVSPGGRSAETRSAAPARSANSGATASPRARSARTSGTRAGGMTVRRLARETADDYRSTLVPGIKSAASAARLADELAFAATRLLALGVDPPGLYGEVADHGGDLEERIWLAVQIALIGPGVDGPDDGADSDPFAGIRATRVSWDSGDAPVSPAETIGPRGIEDPGRTARTVAAYRAWAAGVGGQAAGIAGESGWTPERRFDRGFERLGSRAKLERATRYDLLVVLGRLGIAELEPAHLHLGGSDRVTLAAKRILGIGDPILLERRAEELAAACGLPLAALDLGFDNWERRSRGTAGLPVDAVSAPELLAGARAALALV